MVRAQHISNYKFLLILDMDIMFTKVGPTLTPSVLKAKQATFLVNAFHPF